ncbi:enoyl-CoA hydratase-related protein [Candidatus Leptofilum sp.]|uniref:enoyl-CoA hydratase-related protein n=1 Tax=Candidatus Leptofilum sp. TaxID=3241576 RepID=UPI003B5B8717
MTQSESLVLLHFEGATAVITLNRPQRHNSLVPAMLAAMLNVLATVAANESVRAVVLQANGRSFSTGGDALGFVQHADNMEPFAREIVGLLNQVILAMIDLPVPVITAVHGIVTGGSMGFILGSDIVLVAPEASFAPFYSEVGPSPDGGWAVLLPLIIGPRRAAEVLYLNQAIDAETAVSWGLANRVVPAEKIQAEALSIAAAIAAKKQGSIRHTKRLLHLNRSEIAARLATELDHFVAQMITVEAIDGFRDFVEARGRKQAKVATKNGNMNHLAVGQEASASRTFTAEDIAFYRQLSSDKGLKFGTAAAKPDEETVPGSLLSGMFSDLLGTKLPGRGTNWLKQSLAFPGVAHVGERVTAVVRIIRLRPEKALANLHTTCVTQAGAVVCEGEALVLVKDLE